MNLAAEARRRVAVAPVRAAARPHDALVDGGLDAVVLLDVDFGERVGLEGRGVADVAHRGGVDDVAHDEALDGLVLGNGLPGGRAPAILLRIATQLGETKEAHEIDVVFGSHCTVHT